MTLLKSIWQDLVEKRLWPVAVLLVLALVAVPVLLGRGGGEQAARVPATATPAVDPGAAARQAEVSVDDDVPAPSDRPGALRDPFRPQRSAKAATTTQARTAAPAATTSTASPSSGAPDGATASSGASSASTPSGPSPAAGTTSATAEPAAPTVALRDYAVALRFQPADASRTVKARQDVARLTALPSAKAPAALLLGVLQGGKGAAFMLPSGVAATGEGTCRPSKATCQVVELGVGETEYLDVAGADGAVTAQYVLELVRIDAARVATAAEAKAAHARRSSEGAKLLRDAVKDGASATDAYAYDYDTGVVTRAKAKATTSKGTNRAATRTVTQTVTVQAAAPAPGATTPAPAATTPTWP